MTLGPANQFALTLTGEIAPYRFVVFLREQRVLLPEARFLTLLVLIEAARRAAQGQADIQDFAAHGVAFEKPSLHQLIRRLRKDFDAATESGVGRSLIQHSGWSRYRLAIDIEAVTVCDDFLELEPLLPRSLFARIRPLAVSSVA